MIGEETPRSPEHGVDTRPARDAFDGGERHHLVVFGEGGSSLFQLPPEGRVVIGRAESADLQIPDVSISRQHAAITIRDGAMSIADLGSHNGTYVNRERISGERMLTSGDVISIHRTTLILHCTAPVPVPSIVVALPSFRQRAEDELERAVRYERSFTVLVLLWPGAVPEARRIERALEAQLRRIDAAAWVNDTTMYLLLAEATALEATALVTRIREHLDPEVRIGQATCPDDGAELDPLLASAGTAASSSSPGETTHSRHTHQTLAIGSHRVIVADPAVTRLYALIERIARVDLPVLIIGETGCGKELAATAIHVRSPRRGRPMISLNCAALTETLVESELFGHEKGAFTGALAAKTGLLEAAHGSTLFLDEIGELSLTTQAKLLRVLENRRFTRVGDVHEREVDVRIVAATNRDLPADIEAGRFREDRYFRLSGAVLHVPSLRQRPREVPLLAAAFLDEACARAGRGPMRIGEPAMRALLAHAWPGNVRELRNLMQYAAAAFPDPELRPEHVADRLAPRPRSSTNPLPSAAAPSSGAFRPLAEELRELELARLRAALEATGGNLTRAAALLSVPIRTFSEKVKQYGLSTGRRKRGEIGEP